MFKERAEKRRLNIGLRLIAVAALVLASVGPVPQSEASPPAPDQPVSLFQLEADDDLLNPSVPVSPTGLLALHESPENRQKVAFDLPGAAISADLTRSPKTNLGFTGWTSQSPDLEVTLVENGQVAMARIRSGSRTWLLTPPDNGNHTHRLTETTLIPARTDEIVFNPMDFPLPADSNPIRKATVQSQIPPQPTHRELVVITQEALNRSTPEVISATVAQGNVLQNQVLTSAGVTIPLEIANVITLNVPYETTDPLFNIRLTLDILDTNSLIGQRVWEARTQAQADSTLVYTSGFLPACGEAFRNTPTQSDVGYYSFSFVNSKLIELGYCGGTSVETHEVGHSLLGLRHAQEDDPNQPWTPGARGYKIPGVARDQMAYECDPHLNQLPCPPVLHFSNPTVIVTDTNGVPHPLGIPNIADAAQVARTYFGLSTTFWEQIAPTLPLNNKLFLPTILAGSPTN